MPPEPREDDDVQVLDGPDPRTWPGMPEIWGLVQDIRVIDEVRAALKGEMARDLGSAAYDEARRFLEVAVAQRCDELALVLLSVYQVKTREGKGTGASPFDGAGRPRAFGADASLPERTLLP